MLRTIKARQDQDKDPEKKIRNFTFEQLVSAYKNDYLQGTPSEKVKGYILDSPVKRNIAINDQTANLGQLR